MVAVGALSQHHLSTVECFGILTGGIRLHPSDSQQRIECVGRKPLFLFLSPEGGKDVRNFRLTCLRIQLDKKIWTQCHG